MREIQEGVTHWDDRDMLCVGLLFFFCGISVPRSHYMYCSATLWREEGLINVEDECWVVVLLIKELLECPEPLLNFLPSKHTLL